jgi:hypothetical protein
MRRTFKYVTGDDLKVEKKLAITKKIVQVKCNVDN